MPSHRAVQTVQHHAAVHRGLGREQDGAVAGEEEQYDPQHDQQRPGCDGESDAGGHAVLVPGNLSVTLFARGVCGV